MPTDTENNPGQEFLEKPATITARRCNGSMDNAYIFNYTNNPKAGKAAALRNAGFEGDHVRQEAYRMHQRLRPRIHAVLREMVQDLGTLSHQQLEAILKMNPEDTGLSAMLSAVKLGLDYSGNKPQELELQPTRPTPDERQRRIAALQHQIQQIKGNKTLQQA